MLTPESPLATIIKFLESVKTARLAACPECLSPIEYRDVEFFFDGQTWKIPLPVCPMCGTAVLRFNLTAMVNRAVNVLPL